MTKYDKQRLTEIVLYIINKTNGLDYYRIFKIIYFAEMKLLTKYGVRMTSDKFCALPEGPVPSMLYDCIKNNISCDKELQEMLYSSLEKGNDDADYILSPKRIANMDYLSKADIEVLDESIEENQNLSFGDLMKKSHGNEWNKAYHTYTGQRIMDIIGIAEDGMADSDMIEYIKDNLALEEALS